MTYAEQIIRLFRDGEPNARQWEELGRAVEAASALLYVEMDEINESLRDLQ